MFTRDEFLLKCAVYQKGHNRITLVFIVLFFIQVTLLHTFNLWDAIRGWPVFAASGLELAVFWAVLKIHDKYRGVRCPYCGNRIS